MKDPAMTGLKNLPLLPEAIILNLIVYGHPGTVLVILHIVMIVAQISVRVLLVDRLQFAGWKQLLLASLSYCVDAV